MWCILIISSQSDENSSITFLPFYDFPEFLYDQTIMSQLYIKFKRPTDPPEHNYLFAIPAVALLGSYGYGAFSGYSEMHTIAALTSSLCCIGAIGGLRHVYLKIICEEITRDWAE